MNLRYLIALVFFGCAPFLSAQVELEKPNNPAPSAEPAPAESVPAPQTAPAPVQFPAPPPPAPPREENPLGLLILAVILAHICLPLGLLIGLVLLLIVIKFFRGGLTKLVMGMAATGGGAKAMRGVLIMIGCFIVIPAGFMGLNWAAKWMDHRVSGATWWIYGLVVSVLTGFVFFSVMRAIARAVKKKFMGKMGGMMGGLGGMGGFGGMGGMGGGRDLPGKSRGKKRR